MSRKTKQSDTSSGDEEYFSEESEVERNVSSEESEPEQPLVEFLEEDLGTVWDGIQRKSSRRKNTTAKYNVDAIGNSKSRRPARGFSEGDYVPERNLRTRGVKSYIEDKGDSHSEEDESQDEKPAKTDKMDVEPSESQVKEEDAQDDQQDDDEEEEEEVKPKQKKKRQPKRVEPMETQEIEADDEDDEDEEDEIEKIIACKEVEVVDLEGKKVMEIQYLVKFKDKSYVHCDWLNKEDMEECIQGKQKMLRFDKKNEPSHFIEMDGEYFPAEYCIVERIIDEVKFGQRTCYLVKWKSLPYNEATWEFEETIHDTAKITFYHKYKMPPSDEERLIPSRPVARSWAKMEVSPKFKGENQLREYQLEGLNWLLFCWYNRRNSILADEMGLGKTIQAVSMMETLRAKYGYRGPFLVVVPLSTIAHWQREFESWTELNVIVFHGTSESRQKIIDYEFYWYDKRKKPIAGLFKFNVMITTYETVLSEAGLLGRIQWQYLVIDEGHRLKNKNSKLLEVLRDFKVGHKLLLTGTPIQNDIGELWSLLNFVESNKFNDLEGFLEEFGQLKDANEAKKLHDVIEPYLLRRLKEDVEKSIPPKEEIIVEVVPSKDQKKYYRAILDRNREFLERGNQKKNVPNLVNILMEIRKICNHPFLLKGVEQELTKGMTQEQAEQTLITSSSKMIITDKLLTKLRSDGHKVLIFSQFVMMLNILEDYFQIKKWPYERLDGSIRGDERQASIDRFNDLSRDTFCFLVSTRAGGVGINLTSADTVIIFDSDFNPQNDLQAQARVHRIGQTKDVKIYRLLTKDTKEKEIFQKASMKLGLDRAVLNMEGNEIFEGGAKKSGLATEEIDTLLKHGAYAAYKKDSTEDEKLLEGDLDTIMARSSTVVRYDQEISDKGVSQFSKASFAFNQETGDVDINDKDFWSKVFPENRTPEGLAKKLSSEEHLGTEEAREAFLKDVEECVQEKIGQFQKFIHVDTSALSDLLLSIHNHSIFSEKQRNLAKELFKTLGGRRGGRIQEVDDMEEEDEYKDSKSSLLWPKKGGWFKAERQRFQRGLLELGWSRWGEIRDYKLTNHSEEDLQSFAENFVISCLKFTSDEDDKKFCQDLIMSDATDFKKDSKAQELTLDNVKYFVLSNIAVTLPSGITAPFTLHLVTGDKCVRSAEVTDASTSPVPLTAPGFHGKFFIVLTCGKQTWNSKEFDVGGTHPLFEEQEWLTNAKNGVSMWIRKLHFTYNLSLVMNQHKNKLDAKHIPAIVSKKPAAWWDSECDRDLLISYRKEGFGRGDFKNDSTYCIKAKFDEYLADIKTAKARKEEEDNFPTLSNLNKRAQKLVEKVLKLPTKKAEKKEKKETTKESTGKPSTIVDGWSKREKSDIAKTLGIWGKCPDAKGKPRWGEVVSKAHLRKSEQACCDYATKLLKTCEKYSKDESNVNDLKEFEIAAQTAKKLWEKVCVWDRLATHVYPKLSEHEKKLKYLKNYGSNLPKWWKVEHDVALLNAVKTSGMDFKEILKQDPFNMQTKGHPREGVCTLRLENVCDLMENIEKMAGNEENLTNFAPSRMHPTQTKTAPTKRETSEAEEEEEKKSDEKTEEKSEEDDLEEVVVKSEGKSKITSYMKRKRDDSTDKNKKKKE